MADEGELPDFRRIVELYQAGAVLERLYDGQFGHVGFRYDCMSDDDYFELRELEVRYGIKPNPNWRGDVTQRIRDSGSRAEP